MRNDSNIIWSHMIRRLGGASTGLLVLDKCPICKYGKVQGLANREGYVLARCSSTGCWGNDTEFGELAYNS